jgi:hypothetical protein
MPDYKQLYHRMVIASEDAIEAIECGNPLAARQLLVNAELRAEDAVIRDGEEEESKAG